MPDLPSADVDAPDIPEEWLRVERYYTRRLGRLARLLNRQISELLEKKHGLSLPEGLVLSSLSQWGPGSAADVARWIPMDKGQFSRTLSRLEARGLVVRTTGPDKRSALLKLTAKGRRLDRSTVQMTRQRQRWLVASLDPEARERFSVALDILLEHVEATGHLFNERELER